METYNTNIKRVLAFSLTYLPVVEGHGIAVHEIAKRISERDIEFHIICARFDASLPEYEKIDHVHIHRIGFARPNAAVEDTYRAPLKWMKYLYPFLAWWKARRLHKAYHFDALWSIHAAHAGFATLFTSWSFPELPIVLTLQEGNTPLHYKRRVGMLYPLYRKIFEEADMVHAISKHLKTYARGMGARGEVVVIPNGVDTSLFARRPRKDELAPLLEKLEKKSTDRYLITASRLVEKNGVDDIIRALALLPKRYKLIVAGEGPLGEELWELTGELGVRDRVLFVGALSHEELTYYYHASDVFVRPSRSEGFGNAFIEAMAAELPIIGTPVGGIPDFLKPPESTVGKSIPTGIFCQIYNPKSIAEGVERLFADAPLRKKIIANAQALAKDKYDWNDLAREMEKEVFDTVLKKD